MTDWASVFDESHPIAGASSADLRRFLATVGQPLSAVDVADIKRAQRNPFPANDPLATAWRPPDPAGWVVPGRPPPESYLGFLAWSDGGEFRTGERWVQVFPALDPVHGVRAMMLAYQVPGYMPGAVPFAFNGSGTFYLFDLREPARRGEYPVVAARAGNLGWDAGQVWVVADGFEAACRGTTDIDDWWIAAEPRSAPDAGRNKD